MALLALLATRSAYAVEVTGQIRGTVVDADGLPIPGATVSVSSPNYQGGASMSSNEDGEFRFPALPAGEYTVTVTKDGFLPYKATGVLVVTGSASSLEVPLKLATPGAELTVQEVKPTVDTQKVSSGLVMTRETMRDIPNEGRSYQSTTALTPGVVGSGNVNARGGFDDGNQFYIDGVNNTDPVTGTFSQNMNFDAIEELQVITGGMDAEYGRSMGAAINIITRSGGNEFHGDAQLLYSSQATRLYKPLEGDNPDEKFSDQSLALNLGGPIVKDHLWFFASLQGDLSLEATPVDASVGRPADEPMLPRDWKSGFWFGKVTWSPTGKHRLWLQAQGDPTYIENTEQNPYTLPKGETIQTQGGAIYSLGHIWTPTPKSILQTQLYYQQGYINYYSVACKDAKGTDAIADCTRNLDDAWLGYSPDAFNGGEFPYAYLGKRYRASGNTNFTQYFTFLGEHQAKVGAQIEWLTSVDSFPGVTAYTFKDYTDDPADIDSYQYVGQVRYDNELAATLRGTLVSAYIQDVWNPVERLTIRPGVRMDYAGLANDAGELAFSAVTFAPRLGLAYDLTADGMTSAHAYYGRFYDTGFLAVSDMLHQNSQGYGYYSWNETSGDWNEEPDYTYAPYNLVHSDLKNPYSDEFDLGLARDVGQGWSLDATFTYERATAFWEDDEVNLIWNSAGTDVIGYRNGENEAIFRIRTPEDVFTEYTSLELSVGRQFGDNFGLVGSYVWSHAYGTNDSQFASGTLDNPEQRQYETGLLSYDREHAVKLAGSLRDPDMWHISDDVSVGLLSGWNFRFYSGFPYRKLYYNDYYQDWINYGNALDDSYRTQAISQLDLKAGFTLAIKKTKWDVTAECFNVFNDRTVTEVSTAADESFGDPLTRQSPRYFQFGLRGEF